MPPTFEPVLVKFWQELHDVQFVWQVAALLLCLALAATLSWYVRRQLNLAGDATGERRFAGLLRRLAFPLSALLLVLVARWSLNGYHGISLLNIAVPLLTALVISRSFAYVLRLVFTAGGIASVFERTISWLVWGGFALHVLGLAPGIIAYFDDISFHIGKQKVSLLAVGQAALWIILTLLLTLWVSRLVEEQLMGAQRLQMTLRVMLSKLLRPVLVLLALFLVLPAVGIDLTALSVFGGALGVGIGLGLQRVASSYVSGFVVLLERRVRIGDFVTVDKYHGQVSEIRTRFTVIRSIEGWSLIVPNEMLMTNPVQNFSQQPSARLRCRVGVAYGTDLEALLPRLEAVVAAHPRVVTEPPPVGMLAAFGADGLEVEVACSISQGEIGRSQVQSELNRAILAALRADDIEIPFPQREVRVLGGAPTGYTGKLP